MPQPPPGRSTTLVIGLGNPILRDDGVGWRVAEAVRQALAREPDLSVDVECFALGGLSLMEHMVGYSRAIVIDAMMTGRPPGTITTFRLDGRAGESSLHATAAHDASLPVALELGRRLGADLPRLVEVVGVEAAEVHEFGESLTPLVEAAVPAAARAVLSRLSSY